MTKPCGWCHEGANNWVYEGNEATALESYTFDEVERMKNDDKFEIVFGEPCEECNGTGIEYVDPETGKIDVTEAIFAYEDGTLGARDTVILFARLIETSMCWKLQGSYGRTGASFIEAGMISDKGVIDWDVVNDRLEPA